MGAEAADMTPLRLFWWQGVPNFADALSALAAAEPALELIDAGGDATDMCRRIASCAHVTASSLHGLVVADACGVASTWLDPGAQSHPKYHDYAASAGRAMIAPLTLDEVPARLRGLKDDTGLAHDGGIARARAALNETFPDALRAGADTAGAGLQPKTKRGRKC